VSRAGLDAGDDDSACERCKELYQELPAPLTCLRCREFGGRDGRDIGMKKKRRQGRQYIVVVVALGQDVVKMHETLLVSGT
jgi:hypothetical protein